LIFKLTEFVDSVYFLRIEQRTRPSTLRGYRVMWKQLKPFCENLWIRDVRTKQVQDVLDGLAALEGSREDGETPFNKQVA
jgi:hypothetical protein